jgi:hypothetical protein
VNGGQEHIVNVINIPRPGICRYLVDGTTVPPIVVVMWASAGLPSLPVYLGVDGKQSV